MERKSNLVYIYALIAMIFWGMSFIWSSQLLKYYQPVAIIFIRLIISCLVLFPVIGIFRYQLKIRRKDYLLLFLSAVFNPFLYFIGENTGLKYSTSTITSVIIATIPVFTPFVARITLNERLTWYNITGIMLSFAGVFVMLMSQKVNFSLDPKGLAFLSLAVVSALIYSVMLKKLITRNSPITLIAWQNLIGIFLFIPLFFIFEYNEFIIVTPNLRIVSSFLFLGILASSVAYVLFARTIKVLGISKANIFTNLIPVITAIFSYFILSESFTGWKIAGILIVIAGVYITEISPKQVVS